VPVPMRKLTIPFALHFVLPESPYLDELIHRRFNRRTVWLVVRMNLRCDPAWFPFQPPVVVGDSEQSKHVEAKLMDASLMFKIGELIVFEEIGFENPHPHYRWWSGH